MNLPDVKFNRSGYEIRTDVLSMAKDLVMQEFHSKWNGWEITSQRDPKTGQVVTKVGMPEVPGLDKVLDTADKMYQFINTGKYKL